MKTKVAEQLICPYTRKPLQLVSEKSEGPNTITATFRSPNGLQFRLENGIAVFLEKSLESWTPDESKEYDYYQSTSDQYDAAMDWMFQSFYADEEKFREELLAPLEIKPGMRILETGCGTCRDSIRIAKKMKGEGELYLQDLSQKMIELGQKRVLSQKKDSPQWPDMNFVVGNATTLPFPDQFFDATFHFGGINLFSDRKAALAEMSRVTKKGGKVVVGDEGVAPWHRDTEYGKILMNSNALYKFMPPIEMIPPNSQEVRLRWILGNAYYVIDYRVTDGEPKLNMDLPIQSRRGGTHRTRYFGLLEGVHPETKAKVKKVAAASGLTESEWLDQALRKAVNSEKG